MDDDAIIARFFRQRLDRAVAYQRAARRLVSKGRLDADLLDYETDLPDKFYSFDWAKIDRLIDILQEQPHGAIPDNFVNVVAVRLLRCCQLEELPPPPKLIDLVAARLGTATFGRRDSREAWRWKIVRDCLRDDPGASVNRLHKESGLSRKSIAAAKRDGWPWKGWEQK